MKNLILLTLNPHLNLTKNLSKVVAVFLLPVLLFISPLLMAQQGGKGKVTGKITDSNSGNPLSFATVAIYKSPEQLVEGNITDEKGEFSIDIPFGTYYALVEFMGFEPFKSPEFEVSKEQPVYRFASLQLSPTMSNLSEVVVEGEKAFMELALDKRVFNVGQDLANAGRTTADILMNLPSVSVDTEGNVSLRGSGNVRILIDGKPSGLVSFKGSRGLQQLPASMVESVEVITNPSAKYEAEGMAGVINIILKKDNNQGFNGSFEATVGDPLNIGLAANLNYRHKKINWFVNYGLAKRRQLRNGTLFQEAFGGDTLFISDQSTSGVVNSLNNNIRAGLDYYFNEKSILTGSYLWRRSDAHRITDIRYDDYIFSKDNLQSYSKRRQDETEMEPNSEIIVSYKRSFEQKGHEFVAAFTYLDYWENSDQLFTEETFSPEGIMDPSQSLVQTSINDEFEKQYLIQIDYTKPIGTGGGKFETGLRSSFRNMENDFIVEEQNENGDFFPIPWLDNIFLYEENIHALYGILGNKSNKFSYQGGLRAELTDVTTTLVKTNEVNPRNYINLFPSAHLTYNVNKENAMQISYSRRVRRPVYNDLSPFVTFSDARNFFSGNPDLEPEFTDAFELGHIKYFEKGSLFSTIYYRDTKDKIDRIRTVDNQGNAVTITENLNSELAYGIEFTTDYALFSWWKADVNFNFFHAKIDGSNIQDDFVATTYSWYARQNSRFIFGKGYDIQLRANYQARQKTAQGVRKSIFFMDLSGSKDVLKGKGKLILTVADIFNSRRDRYIVEGTGFVTTGDFQNVVRQVNLTLNYRIK
ncbi:TonB-dependent receptor [Aquiflexum sp. TKW24L]|uniref:TonB-dependent receptor domain-containing protein n=1 Tax=Aquiflexum sp. TKW24L TaxID=2942212 RepID=UPI0032DE3A22